ncbi:hypothetical protein BC937DRAFT_88801 [Endogone sp. FLAS-F59071]|nr:hypothetical protein BC937DRAFT_91325 [Endogone sp. FLAS-F59071]RUS18402.1 hypothetical protein BC937DRAFT_88801 [Endogone sp. FLAS-F59071]|eukprot:RUS16340.1 hypothetical protein BC937DRAFT_91325 [Endogone sp. FLAS-F59071]
MATLTDLDLRPRIKDALKRASFEYPADLLKLPSSDLQKRLRLSENDASELIKVVAHSVYLLQQRASSALALLQRSGQFLTTGDEGMDQVLGGGLLTRGITEIVGERLA